MAGRALALDPSLRDEFIAANASDPEERARVLQLLSDGESVTRTRALVAEGRIEQPPLAAAPERISHYRIEQCIGEGGMGAVYRAHDERLNRTVAIKLIHPGRSLRPENRIRFYNEAQAASSLNHPSIVTIHDIDAHEGVDYIVMEYIEGQTLRAMIAQGPLRLEDALRYGSQIADAAAAAHAASIVHRDLKPDNAMVTPRRLVKVLDFGLAKLTQMEGAPDPHITTEGALIGTVSYMSPEQARGFPADHRVDIFAFGVMLQEMITGRRAFPGANSTAVLAAILADPPEPLPANVPHGVADLVGRCLEKDRDKRIASMDEVKQALDQLLLELQLSGTSSARLSSIQPPAAPAPVPARKWAIPLGIAAMAALASGVAWYRTVAARESAAPSETVLTRLTSDAGLTAYPDLSRDAKTVIYASDRASSGNLDIWMQRIGGGAVRLTTDDADDYEPSLSPDGTRIAYRSDRAGGGIHVMTVPDGASRLLVAGGRSPRFSPDGSSIAYWTGYEGGSMVPGSARIFVIPVSGGEPRELLPGFGAASGPLWSPDGKQVLFLGKKSDGHVDWYIAPAAGGGAKATGALAATRARKLRSPLVWQAVIRPLAFTNDGGAIVFAADAGDSTNIWEIPFSLATGTTTGTLRRLSSGAGMEHQATLPADPQTMVFSSLSMTLAIWSAPVDARSGEIRGEFTRLGQDLSAEYFPSISADGKKLAFLSGKDGNYSIAVRDLTSNRDTVLAVTKERLSQPQISSDGRYVAYWEVVSSGKEGQPRQYMIRLVDTAGGAAETICDGCGPASSFSADSRYVLFEPVSGRNSVMILDRQTREKRESVVASSEKQLFFHGRFSPNQKLVSYHGSLGPADRNGVFIAPVKPEGAGERDWIRLSDVTGEDTDASWAPAGDLLYFLSGRDGFRCVWARNVNPATGVPTGGPRPIAHFHHARRSLRFLGNRFGSVGISVAGGRLYLAMADLTGNVWMSSPAPR